MVIEKVIGNEVGKLLPPAKKDNALWVQRRGSSKATVSMSKLHSPLGGFWRNFAQNAEERARERVTVLVGLLPVFQSSCFFESCSVFAALVSYVYAH